MPMLSQYLLPSRFSQFDSVWPERTQAASMELPEDPAKLMPACHNMDLMLLMAERYLRADQALAAWAKGAKEAIDFVEGRQWSEKEIREAELEDRPLITLNKMAPLLRLIIGYHRNTRTDIRYLPTGDQNSTEAVAAVLTKVMKQIAINSEEQYLDAEVFFDGIVSGRGYYDWRLSFEKNDFGEISGSAKDPFTIRPDPDADQYDPKAWAYVFEARWASLDEIEFHFGRRISALIWPLVHSSGYRGGLPLHLIESVEEIAPWRTFGGRRDEGIGFAMEPYIANSVDPYRKNIRIIDCQHYIRVMQRNIVDLETGDREPIPDHFSAAQVEKLMAWCHEQYAMRGKACPLRVEWRPTRRVRWTTMIADIVVHDDWSPYESFTIVPFFPYWRRGMTRSPMEDWIPAQREINKRRSAAIDILTRIPHSGWMWHENALREEEKEKIELHGAAPGINIEWRGTPDMKPERIQPATMPNAMRHLEEAAVLDLKEIAGINDSALGQLDRVQSGRAIEARQRQSVLGIEMYMDNMRRTKRLVAMKKLELVQNHYTEPRLYRIQGDNSQWSWIGINLRQATGDILHNVTIGKYEVAIDESPLTATWLNAQFEELLSLVERGVLPVPMVQDVLIDLSSAPQKELLKQRLSAYMRSMGMLTADDLLAAQQQAEASGIPIDPMRVPPPNLFGAERKPNGGSHPSSEGGIVAAPGTPSEGTVSSRMFGP